MEKAEEKNDSKAIDALIAKADILEQQVGPEYEGIVEGLDRVDPNSAEGQKFVAVFNTLRVQIVETPYPGRTPRTA